MDYEFISPPDSLPPLQEHPDYVKGIAYIEAGQWQQAVESLQLLPRIYPDEAELKELLEEAQMRVTMARFRPARKSKRRRPHRTRRLLAGALVAMISALLLYTAYALWINPLLVQELRLRQVTRLRDLADEAIVAGDYTQARQALEQLQEILPKDPETKAALSRIEEAEKLSALYQEAEALIATESWDQALETLTELQSLDAQYRDLPRLLQLVQEAQELDKQFQAAEAAFAQGDWAEAVARYEVLQQANITFKFEETQARLFESQLKYGQMLLTEGSTDPAQVSEALEHLSAALKVRPMDSEALDERHLAETYLAALNAGDRDQTIELLQTIYDQRPDYAGQAAAQLLYTNLLTRADTFLQTDNKAAALDDYQTAATLSVEDPSEAQEKLNELTAETSP